MNIQIEMYNFDEFGIFLKSESDTYKVSVPGFIDLPPLV